MISTPQEVEGAAIAIANWIAYNGRPFIIHTDDGKIVYLAVLSQDELMKLQGQPVVTTEPEKSGE